VVARRGVHIPGEGSQAEPVLSVTVTMLLPSMERRPVIMER